jgi:SNF2 family DNA or RNA helicase
MTLQQIVSGYLNINRETPKYFKNNYRVDMLEDVIRQIPIKKKVIIWCKYHYDLKLIQEALKDEVSIFSGKLNEKQKEQAINDFKSDKRFFVATPSSGGYGLTLNEAHYVIFYNNSFKYSERLQAEDRCHRIGQKEKVTYIDIVCSDSIDERIMKALSAKKSVAEAFKEEVEKIKNKKDFINFIKKL